MPLPEPWNWFLSFHGRHPFLSSLPTSYPLGVQAQEYLSFKSTSFPSDLHDVPAASPHQFLNPISIQLPVCILLCLHFLSVPPTCLPSTPLLLPFLSQNSFSLAPLSLRVLSHLSKMLCSHSVYPSKLSRHIPSHLSPCAAPAMTV